MKRYTWLFLTLAAVPAVATAAQYHHIAGASCQSSYSVDQFLMRTTFISNFDSSARNISCPIELTGPAASSVNPLTVDPSAGRVDFTDNSVSQEVSCSLRIVTSTGTTATTATRYGCGMSGGCPGSSAYFGSNYLTFVDTISSTANVVGVDVYCTIPAFDNTYGDSRVYGVAVSTATP